MNKLVQIAAADMVAVALQPLQAGETVDYGAGSVTLLADIPMGHKVALRDIQAGEPVVKYGFPIGQALADIPRGGHVHTHNLKTLLSGEKGRSRLTATAARTGAWASATSCGSSPPWAA